MTLTDAGPATAKPETPKPEGVHLRPWLLSLLAMFAIPVLLLAVSVGRQSEKVDNLNASITELKTEVKGLTAQNERLATVETKVQTLEGWVRWGRRE